MNGGPGRPSLFSSIIQKSPPRASEERMAMADFVPLSRAGTFVAADAARGQILDSDGSGYDHVGMASWYGGKFHGRRTADGEVFDRGELTAAHLSLPMPSYVRVTNLANNRSIVLRVNDRGPYSGNRMIDVSERAAELLAFHRSGSTKVRVQYISAAPRSGDDSAILLASYRGPTLPVTQAVAFVQPEDPGAQTGAAAALLRISQRASASNRILMAFAAAGVTEEE